VRVVPTQEHPVRPAGKRPPQAPRPPRRRRFAWIALGIVALTLGPPLVRLYVDSLWFREIGFLRVLATELVAQGVLFAVVAVVAFAFLWGNARTALSRGAALPILVQGPDGKPHDDPIFGRDVAYYVFTLPVVAGVLGLLFTLGLLSLSGRAALAWLRREVQLAPDGRLTVERGAGIHLAALGAFFFCSPPRGSCWCGCRSCCTPPPGRWWAPATPT
jgi:uncharacterized membrane protein (UPF0182 family)